MPADWTPLERVPPGSEEPDVLVNGEPRVPDEAELRATRRDDKWKQKGYVR